MFGANPLRPPDHGDGTSLWIQEVFYTLQGEGPFAGRPALFVRIGGCNLQCFWCDTDFESSTWRPTIEELLTTVDSRRPAVCSLVVITGGEPYRQNLRPFVDALLARGLDVQIETNGTLYQDLGEAPRVTVVVSPKTAGLNTRLAARADAYKYVVAAGEVGDDGLPERSTHVPGRAERIARPGRDVPVYVMPRDDGDPTKNAANRLAAAEIAQTHGYFLTLQLHKLLGLP